MIRLTKFALKIACILLGGTILLILPWRWIPPPTTSFMLQYRMGRLEKAPPLRYKWVSWDKISPQVPIAMVAAEDQKFPEHHGFDIESIQGAMEEKRRRGASTISQQVVKNLYLWPGPSWIRKGIEAYLTVFVEALWPKRRILEVYVNVAELGPGIYGVGAASASFFRKSPSKLTLAEAARLAAVLPNPKRFSVARPSPYVLERAAWIARQVEQLGGPGYLKGSFE